MNADLLSVLLRTLAFAALFQSAGTVFFLILFGTSLRVVAARLWRLGRVCAAVAIPLTAMYRCLDAARMAGDLSGLVDMDLQRLAWLSRGGLVALLQILGMAVIAVKWRCRQRAALLLAAIGAVIAVVAPVLTGHTSAHPQHSFLTPLLALHLLILAFWFGALLPLIVCCRHESGEAAFAVMRGFSALAGWLVPCIGLAGAAMALVLLPHSADWRSTYALLILLKISLFVLLLLLAAWNRWRLVPARAATALQRTIWLEFLLMIVVIGITVTMTSLVAPPMA